MPASYLEVVELVRGDATTPIETWLDRNLSELRSKLQARGAVLLRGFRAEADTVAQQVLSMVGSELLDDAFWSTPRTGVSAKTFTATEYPKERTIALHSEMAYMAAWPRLVAFHALVVASRGGETTICDIDAVSRELSSALDTFQRLGVRYRRTYHAGVDVPWQKAFRATNPAEVAATAQRFGMEVRWLDGDTLQTVHDAQGCVTDEAGRPLWFNQAHVFHRSNVPPSQLAMLIELFGDDCLPRDALYGDGTPIPDEIMHRVNGTFSRLALGVAWQPGDVLLLDNMRFAHGRLPFEGTRKLHVALANQQTVRARTPLFETA